MIIAILFSLSLFFLPIHLKSNNSDGVTINSKWSNQSKKFINDCKKGIRHLNRNTIQLLITAYQNKSLDTLNKKAFTPQALKVISNPLINDNFAQLTERAYDLDFKSHNISFFQQALLEFAFDNKKNHPSYFSLSRSAIEFIKKSYPESVKKILCKIPVDLLVNTFGQTGLILAIKRNNNAIAELLLQYSNYTINFRCFDELNTALHWAIIKNNFHIFELILAYQKVNINLKNARGKTALMLAVINQKTEFVKRILEVFPDINLCEEDHTGNTVFDFAHNSAEIKAILECHQISHGLKKIHL